MTLTLRALVFATRAHSGQHRKYGTEPYVSHPVAVAAAVERAELPPEVVAAALLHDVVEDCGVDPDDIRRQFGSTVADLVLEVTEVSRPGPPRAVRKALDRDHFARASSWGQSIKLADVAHNAGGIATTDPKFARIYLPELEDLLRVLTAGDESLKTEARRIVGIEVALLSRLLR